MYFQVLTTLAERYMQMNRDMRSLCTKVEFLISANPRFTVQEIAHSIGTDRHNIESAVRIHCGCRFEELKKRARLKRTRTLLDEQPSRYLKEVAAEVGVTPNHLSRFIKLMTGQRARDLRCHKR
jgi:transcriptional regulator GlxA family with amidase domain